MELEKDGDACFNKFVKLCKRVTDNDTEVLSLLDKRYQKAAPEYIHSKDFPKLVHDIISKIEDDPTNKYVFIQQFVSKLRTASNLRKVQGGSRAEKRKVPEEVTLPDLKRVRTGTASGFSSASDSELESMEHLSQCVENHNKHKHQTLTNGSGKTSEDDASSTAAKPVSKRRIVLESVGHSEGEKDKPSSKSGKLYQISCQFREGRRSGTPDIQDKNGSKIQEQTVENGSMAEEAPSSEKDKNGDANEEIQEKPSSTPSPVPCTSVQSPIPSTSAQSPVPSTSAQSPVPCTSAQADLADALSDDQQEEIEDSDQAQATFALGMSRREKMVNEKRVQKLERILKKLSDAIKKLEEKELDLDDLDKEDTSYLLTDKYKKKITKVWNKLCQIQGYDNSTGRVVEKQFKFNGTRYPEVNKKIQKFVNKYRMFPDYQDIRGVIEICNKKHHLSLGRRAIEELARDVFVQVGNELQQIRHSDFVSNFGSHLTDHVRDGNDPATYDISLRRKLDTNRQTAKSKLDEVFSKYSQRQDLGDDGEESAAEGEDKEEDGDEEEEEDVEDDEEAIAHTEDAADAADEADEGLADSSSSIPPLLPPRKTKKLSAVQNNNGDSVANGDSATNSDDDLQSADEEAIEAPFGESKKSDREEEVEVLDLPPGGLPPLRTAENINSPSNAALSLHLELALSSPEDEAILVNSADGSYVEIVANIDDEVLETVQVVPDSVEVLKDSSHGSPSQHVQDETETERPEVEQESFETEKPLKDTPAESQDSNSERTLTPTLSTHSETTENEVDKNQEESGEDQKKAASEKPESVKSEEVFCPFVMEVETPTETISDSEPEDSAAGCKDVTDSDSVEIITVTESRTTDEPEGSKTEKATQEGEKGKVSENKETEKIDDVKEAAAIVIDSSEQTDTDESNTTDGKDLVEVITVPDSQEDSASEENRESAKNEAGEGKRGEGKEEGEGEGGEVEIIEVVEESPDSDTKVSKLLTPTDVVKNVCKLIMEENKEGLKSIEQEIQALMKGMSTSSSSSKGKEKSQERENRAPSPKESNAKNTKRSKLKLHKPSQNGSKSKVDKPSTSTSPDNIFVIEIIDDENEGKMQTESIDFKQDSNSQTLVSIPENDVSMFQVKASRKMSDPESGTAISGVITLGSKQDSNSVTQVETSQAKSADSLSENDFTMFQVKASRKMSDPQSQSSISVRTQLPVVEEISLEEEVASDAPDLSIQISSYRSLSENIVHIVKGPDEDTAQSSSSSSKQDSDLPLSLDKGKSAEADGTFPPSSERSISPASSTNVLSSVRNVSSPPTEIVPSIQIQPERTISPSEPNRTIPSSSLQPQRTVSPASSRTIQSSSLQPQRTVAPASLRTIQSSSLQPQRTVSPASLRTIQSSSLQPQRTVSPASSRTIQSSSLQPQRTVSPASSRTIQSSSLQPQRTVSPASSRTIQSSSLQPQRTVSPASSRTIQSSSLQPQRTISPSSPKRTVLHSRKVASSSFQPQRTLSAASSRTIPSSLRQPQRAILAASPIVLSSSHKPRLAGARKPDSPPGGRGLKLKLKPRRSSSRSSSEVVIVSDSD